MPNAIDQYDLRFPSKVLETFILLQRVANSMSRAQEKGFESLRVASLTEVWVLYVLVHSREAPTPTEIGRWIFREQHSTGELLQRMERRGLVTRVKDERDRRFTRVVITPKGRQIFEAANETRVVAKLMECLSEEDLAALSLALSKLQRSSAAHLGLRLKVKKVTPRNGTSSGAAGEETLAAS